MRKIAFSAVGVAVALAGLALPAKAAPFSQFPATLSEAADEGALSQQVKNRHWNGGGRGRHYGWHRGRHNGWYGRPQHYGQRYYGGQSYYGRGPGVYFEFGGRPRPYYGDYGGW